MDKLQKVKEALEYYSNKDNHKLTSEPYWNKRRTPPVLEYPLGYPSSKVLSDKGMKAKEALAELTEFMERLESEELIEMLTKTIYEASKPSRCPDSWEVYKKSGITEGFYNTAQAAINVVKEKV